LEYNDPLRLPIAFEHFGFAPAHNVFSAVLLHGSAGELFIFFVADAIDDLNLDDDVGRHCWVSEDRNLEAVSAAIFCSELRNFPSPPYPQPVVPGFAQAVSRGLVLLV